MPISRIGCYIPGGKARYPSTVIMCTIPAKVAGVKQIVAISPPMENGKIDPFTLIAALKAAKGGRLGVVIITTNKYVIKEIDPAINAHFNALLLTAEFDLVFI